VTTSRTQARPVRAVFIGSGAFAQPALHALARDPMVELVGIVTAPPRPAGRKLASVATPIAKLADELQVAHVLTPARLRDQAAISQILALEPDLIVLADYGQIVPPALLGIGKGALNLHPSLLPRHRGATPVPATILAGDRATGVTLMRMDEGLDTGPIVAQAGTPVEPEETAPELEARLAAMGAELLTSSLGPWLAGDLREHAQPVVGVTLTKPLRREDGRMDLTLPAEDLDRQVRAYQPWPGSFVDTRTGRLTVWAASPAASEHLPSGRFSSRGLATGEGTLLLHEVQPAGGRRMPWVEFLRGRPGIVGSDVVLAI
jgi:methionyl-tRNA formyltransferase